MTVYEIITNKIIEQLKKGVVPWKRPWKTDWPQNYVTKKGYRGINIFLLLDQDFSCPYWATFKQINELGGRVKKGEPGTIIVFWKLLEKEIEDADMDAKTDEKKKRIIPLLRYYRVWNLEQTEGIDWQKGEQKHKSNAQILEEAEKIVENMPNKPIIKVGAQASYNHLTDTIKIPEIAKFYTAAGYYGTLFHELGHATGHEKRLNRPGLVTDTTYGSEIYSKEELVSEMTASFLLGYIGFQDDREIENAAAYIGGWLERLQNDSRLIIQAATQAQKAADYILGITEEEESREETE